MILGRWYAIINCFSPILLLSLFIYLFIYLVSINHRKVDDKISSIFNKGKTERNLSFDNLFLIFVHLCFLCYICTWNDLADLI